MCLIPAVAFGIFVQTSALQRKNISPIRNDALGFRSIETAEYSPSVGMAIFLNPRCGQACVVRPGLLGREKYAGLLRESRGAPSQYLTDNERSRYENDPHILSPVASNAGRHQVPVSSNFTILSAKPSGTQLVRIAIPHARRLG
jgi:hypothetical protein